jgi:AbrB family looped-hinge helix DNA binding protein
MKQMISIDQAGRLVLPKPLRQRLRLRAGDFLTVEVRGDAIELRPNKPTAKLKRVNGVLVYSGGESWDTNRDLVAESREDRINDLISRGGVS